METVVTVFFCLMLAVILTWLYYEVMQIVWRLMPHLHFLRRRLRPLFVVLTTFVLHLCMVTVYAACYWLGEKVLHIGTLSGVHEPGWPAYYYFSAATYSSLGYGDIFPHGGLQVLASLEVLNGLVLIGWSVSYIFLAMQKYWERPTEEPSS